MDESILSAEERRALLGSADETRPNSNTNATHGAAATPPSYRLVEFGREQNSTRDEPPMPHLRIAPDADLVESPFADEHLRTVELIHQTFAHELQNAWLSLFHGDVGISLVRVDRILFSEFLLGLDNPTCAQLVNVEPLAGVAVLEIVPQILFPLLDRLLGGDRPGPIVRRPLTEIERRLTARLSTTLFETLDEAWSVIGGLQFRSQSIECHPQRVRCMPPSQPCVVTTWELRVGETQGSMRLVLPQPFIDAIAERLRETTLQGGDATAEVLRETVRPLGADATVIVAVGETLIDRADVMDLRIGDIIATDTNVEDLSVMMVDGQARFRVRVGQLNGQKAALIESKVG
ncbi:MAG: FliM/FliN family flagellar motor switch protein [Pirellulaceae bacterium]|nr:flagellar motor switch protein FliM [Planctomycetales bacterium]